MKKYLLAFYIAILLFSFSCNDDFKQDVKNIKTVSAGQADFSKYVALGNSITSAFMNGSQFESGQKNSYAIILAERMKMAGGGNFNTPYIKDENGGLLINGDNLGRSRPTYDVKLIIDPETGTPKRINANPQTDIANNIYKEKGPFNNLAAASATTSDLLMKGYGDINKVKVKGSHPENKEGGANPFYVRFASSPEASILDDALAQKPTFFSLWIGNNDILGYALNPSKEKITAIGDFKRDYTKIIESLTEGGAKGAVANIPNIPSVPYFNTIPYNVYAMDDSQAALANRLFGVYNLIVGFLTSDEKPEIFKNIPGSDFLWKTFKANYNISKEEASARKITFVKGRNGALIKDESLQDIASFFEMLFTIASLLPLPDNIKALMESIKPEDKSKIAMALGQLRQLKPGEHITLIAAEQLKKLRNNMSLSKGSTLDILSMMILPPSSVLTKLQKDEIVKAVDSYNQVIKEVAQKHGLAYVDTYSLLEKLNSHGLQYNNVNYSMKFISGGGFSLDGIHLTGVGQAYIANAFIDAINTKYQSGLKKVDPTFYPGNKLP